MASRLAGKTLFAEISVLTIELAFGAFFYSSMAYANGVDLQLILRAKQQYVESLV
jgi:hypothetical protein